MLFTLAVLAGCATDPNTGRKMNFAQTLQKWEDSMNNTESRLQDKRYND